MAALIDTTRRVVFCPHCHESIPMPLGVVSWFAAVGRAFDRAHKRCKPGVARTVALCRFDVTEG